ncbi:MAG: hypothetical protein OEW67_07725 [Cyclobacteriaceae bacterium]|nr:hypothetical protein [Cyclobacteriaceae bacterium]
MLRKGFLKPEISIYKLTPKRFWKGAIIGVGISIILSYFFNYSRESLRVITLMADLYILPEKDFRLYDLFSATLATSIAFGFTIIFWLRGRNPNIKKRYLKKFAISNSWLLTFVILMVVARFESVLHLILFDLQGYDNHLNILKDFWILLLLIPGFVYFSNWNIIRLIFRTRNWIFISVFFYCLTAFILFIATSVDREVLNQTYYFRNQERFDYIDLEFQYARQKGVFFADSTKQILRKKYAERTTNLVLDLKNSFNSDRTVSLDTLILEKIVIHNMNLHGLYFNNRDDCKDENWSYALPEELYSQILKHNINSVETKVLFDILSEQKTLFTAKEINWDEWDNYSYLERERSLFRNNLFYTTETIQSRLIQVIEKLNSDKRFEKYHHLILPDMEFNSDRGDQTHYELILTDANNTYE